MVINVFKRLACTTLRRNPHQHNRVQPTCSDLFSVPVWTSSGLPWATANKQQRLQPSFYGSPCCASQFCWQNGHLSFYELNNLCAHLHRPAPHALDSPPRALDPLEHSPPWPAVRQQSPRHLARRRYLAEAPGRCHGPTLLPRAARNANRKRGRRGKAQQAHVTLPMPRAPSQTVDYPPWLVAHADTGPNPALVMPPKLPRRTCATYRAPSARLGFPFLRPILDNRAWLHDQSTLPRLHGNPRHRCSSCRQPCYFVAQASQ